MAALALFPSKPEIQETTPLRTTAIFRYSPDDVSTPVSSPSLLLDSNLVVSCGHHKRFKSFRKGIWGTDTGELISSLVRFDIRRFFGAEHSDGTSDELLVLQVAELRNVVSTWSSYCSCPIDPGSKLHRQLIARPDRFRFPPTIRHWRHSRSLPQAVHSVGWSLRASASVAAPPRPPPQAEGRSPLTPRA